MKNRYKLHPFFEDPPPQIKSCDHPECLEEGLYKAPRSRTKLREYFWFCLDHIRQYNQKWNYFVGMSEAEVERSWYDIFTWERPTRPFGAGGFTDPMDLFTKFRKNLEREKEAFKTQELLQKALTPEERQALRTLDLAFPYTMQTLRGRYKQLVKVYHPDANGGCVFSEEKLKTINIAYEILKKALKSGL